MLLAVDFDAVARRQAEAIGNVALRACPRYDPSDKNTDPWEILALAQFPQQWASGEKLEMFATYNIHFICADPERYLDQFVPAQIEVTPSHECKKFWPGATAALAILRAAQAQQRAKAAKASDAGGPAVLAGVSELIPLHDDFGNGFGEGECGGGGDFVGHDEVWEDNAFDALFKADEDELLPDQFIIFLFID